MRAGIGGTLYSSSQCYTVWSFPTVTDHLGDFQLAVIPTVGFSDPLLSYFSALRLIFNGLPMLKYGYEKVTLSVL